MENQHGDEEKKLKLNKITVENIIEQEMVQEVRRMIGNLPSAANCPTIDGKTCLCRTQNKSCGCPPPLPGNKTVVYQLLYRN